MVDKIEQFAAELADPRTDPEERLVALKFVLPDAGGDRKRVVPQGFWPGNLHHFWDTEWVRRLGDDPRQIADRGRNLR